MDDWKMTSAVGDVLFVWERTLFGLTCTVRGDSSPGVRWLVMDGDTPVANGEAFSTGAGQRLAVLAAQRHIEGV